MSWITRQTPSLHFSFSSACTCNCVHVCLNMCAFVCVAQLAHADSAWNEAVRRQGDLEAELEQECGRHREQLAKLRQEAKEVGSKGWGGLGGARAPKDWAEVTL